MTPEQYLKLNDLWDIERLKQHAQANSVYVIESKRFPGLAMTHYMDECQYDDKWTEFSRMSRGLVLDVQNRKVMHWGYSKFFNMNQCPETNYDILKTKGSFEVSEKIDGSMISVIQDPNTKKFHCLTKGSMDSEHGLYATSIMPDVLKDSKLIDKYSLIFELIAKQFQIVVNYKNKGYPEGLYLTGAREKNTNRLLSYSEVTVLAAELGLPCIKTYSFESLDELIETSQNLGILDEGFVLRWEPELLVKIKGPKYLELHRFISHLSDRNILEAVANNIADELKAVCPEEYKQDVLDKIDHFQKRVVELENLCYNLYKDAPCVAGDISRKDFAIWVNKNVPSHFKGFLFKLLDCQPIDRKLMFKKLEEIDNIDGRTRI
jgi:RNA ligase